MVGARLSLCVAVLLCVVQCQENQRSPWDRTSDTLCFDGTATAGWEVAIKQAPWTARTGHGSVSFQQMMYVMGGRSANGALLNDMWESADGKEWKASDVLPGWSGRQRFGVVNMNNKIWVMGGIMAAPNGAAVVSNEVWSLSSDGSGWDQIVTYSNTTSGANTSSAATPTSSTAPMWAPRHSMITMVFQGRIWVISGVEALVEASAAQTSDFRHDIWSTVDGVNWRRDVETAPWRGRRTAVGAMYQLRMYVLAESADYRYYYNVWGSADGTTWSEPPGSCAVSGERVADALVIESGLVVIGAVDGLAAGNLSASMWYSPPGANFNGTFLKSASPVGTGARVDASYAGFLGRIWQTGGYCPACAQGNKEQTFSDVQSSGSLTFPDITVGSASKRARSVALVFILLLCSLSPLWL
uniref:Uncharacterized protein n=3 Tax=Hemiselmis andersenii TaxID=464988 RepID=A0A7S1DUT9_HEMAN|mmetsp:Transcript_28772/g.70528  ORF Transcript_28772/g.70528 Transcript_28772/m.70528 type:complete len:413 (+) Transcript_28772:192-1430(+)